MMQKELNARTFQHVMFFITVWIFFSLNSKFLRIPNGLVMRWVFLGLVIVLSFVADGSFVLKPPRLLFFFIIAVSPSIFLGIHQGEAFLKFLSFIVVIWGGYIYFNSLKTSEEIEMAMKMMMFVMIAFELQSVFFVAIGRGFDGDRMNGNTTNPNTLGIYSNLAFLAAFYWYGKTRGFKKAFFLIIMLLSVLTALGSGSRTAFVAILLNIIVAWLVIFRKSAMRFVIFLPIILVVILLITGQLEKLGIQAINRLLSGDEGTTRGDLWDKGIQVWRQYPVFGCGYTVSVYLNPNEEGEPFPFHNSYLSLLAEVGIWGVTVFGFGMILNGVEIVKSFVADIKKKTDVTTLILCVMMMAELLFAAWSESFLFAVGSTEACTFWLLFTWSLVYANKNLNDNRELLSNQRMVN